MIKEKPIVSIIIISYNNFKYIFDTIDSIFIQTYPEIELVFADDGSNYFDKQEIELYITKNNKGNIKKITFLLNPINEGTVRNINHAIDGSHGEMLFIIAADDIYDHENVISRMVERCLLEDLDLCFADFLACDEALKIIPDRSLEYRKQQVPVIIRSSQKKMNYLIWRKNVSLIATQATCYSRKFFNKYGSFDTNYRLVEDQPMLNRIINSKAKYDYEPIVAIRHRVSTGISSLKRNASDSYCQYLVDLLRFFSVDLWKQRNDIGSLHILMRKRFIEFRLAYIDCMKMNVSPIIQIFRFADAIIYYGIFNMPKLFRYIIKK